MNTEARKTTARMIARIDGVDIVYAASDWTYFRLNNASHRRYLWDGRMFRIHNPAH